MAKSTMESQSKLVFRLQFEVEGAKANATEWCDRIRSAIIAEHHGTIIPDSVHVRIEERHVTHKRRKP